MNWHINKFHQEKRMNNLHYFEISRNHEEPLIDPYYQKGVLVIPKTNNESNYLTINNGKLLELISAFHVLDKMGKQKDAEEIQNIVNQVVYIMSNVESINYTAFAQFFMVYNLSYSLFCSFNLEKKRAFIYEMLKKFCKERHSIYLSHGYSNSILQVMSDNYSHKRNSKSGILKVSEILRQYHVEPFSQCTKPNMDFYFLPDKGKKNLFENFLIEQQVEMKSRETEQDKLPDIVFKHENDYFIMELKSMKEGGGGQNKQIVEIANFIRYSEMNPHIHYITFLDGAYTNLIFHDNSPKLKKQREDILSSLKRNPANYFVNTAGFQSFCSDLFVPAKELSDIA